MSQIEVDKLIPQSGTALQIGEASDTITVPASATLTLASGSTLNASSATVSLPTGVGGTSWQETGFTWRSTTIYNLQGLPTSAITGLATDGSYRLDNTTSGPDKAKNRSFWFTIYR